MGESNPAGLHAAYRIHRELGRGGMGVVYEAWDTRLERRVAVKVLHPERLHGADAVKRVLAEARLAARVTHPNVVRIYRVEEVAGELAIEMEYVDGSSLADILVGAPFTPPQAVQLLRHVLEGLAACHAVGVIHCDLKPGNLLITPQSQVFLADFGIAHAARPTHATFTADDDTDPMAFNGYLWTTPSYAAPEVWCRESPTPGWDLYAAGVVIIEAMRGEPLFRGTPEAVLRQKTDCAGLDRLLAETGASMPFVALLRALIEPDPHRRLSDAGEALRMLRKVPEFSVDPADTQPLVPGPTTPSRARRRRMLGVVAGLFLLALLGMWYVRSRPSQRNEANPGAVSTAQVDRFPSMVVSGSYAFFTMDDGLHGRELWCYWRRTAPPHLVLDLAPGAASSNPRQFWPWGKAMFFVADSPEHGAELWFATPRNDLPPEIRLVKDIAPGELGSEPEPVAAMGDRLFFYATTLERGRELWCTNGRPALTALVADLAPQRENAAPTVPSAVVAGDKLYFLAYGGEEMRLQVWQHDAQTYTTRPIAFVSDTASEMAALGDALLFANHGPATGVEPWIFRPERQEARLLLDIVPGETGSMPNQLFQWNGVLFFQAETPETGRELWSTDGTPEGTRLVADIEPGPEGSRPYDFVSASDRVFFRAQTTLHGKELWVTDGTPEGTQVACDAAPGSASGTPYNLTWNGKHLFFSANDGIHGEEAWVIKGGKQEMGATMLLDLRPGPESAEPHNLQWWDETHGIFVATGPSGVQGLFEIVRRESAWDVVPVDFDGMQDGGSA